MDYRLYQNLQNSLVQFLQTNISDDSLTGDNGASIAVYAGYSRNKTWTLPCISAYMESETLERFEIGSNLRDDRQLLIIDIYGTNENERLSIAKWVVDTINDGWRYFSYSFNVSNPESPNKSSGGMVNVDFLTNTKVALGQNVDVWDAHRHRVSINVWITNN